MSIKVSTRLTSHLKGTEKTEFATRIIENKPILDRVVSVLESDLKTSRNFQINRESFEKGDWAFKAAYEAGYQKALEEVITLLTLRIKNAER